jgi:hypothetical protein
MTAIDNVVFRNIANTLSVAERGPITLTQDTRSVPPTTVPGWVCSG